MKFHIIKMIIQMINNFEISKNDIICELSTKNIGILKEL